MRFITISVAAAVSALFLAGLQVAEAQAACDATKCVHPACVCPSTKPPKGMDPQKAPQFVTLTFDDAVQKSMLEVTSSLMANHRNPNGCSIPATWFAQNLYSDYSLIQQWYASGNEIADHTMTHVGSPPIEEVVGNRKAINAFSGIPYSKMTGFRAPFLNYSKATFDILGQEKIEYDSSTTADTTTAYWPYTLDFGLANDCWNGICSAGVAQPGMWEIPMHAIMDDSTPPIAHNMDVHLEIKDTAKLKSLLLDNFNRHYTKDRAPFGIYLHPVHVGTSSATYNEFFTEILRNPDVWFVTNQQMLQWMKNPVPASELANQEYMKCTRPAVGKEICNGLADTANGAIDAGVLELCNFAAGPWSTCYGCPKTAPSPADPVPERMVAVGQVGARTPVPTTCAMEWWDPVAAQCLCTSTNCTFTDTAVKPTATGGPGAKPTGGSGKDNAAGMLRVEGTWVTLGLLASVTAGLVQLL
ncbi:hypothetical protein BGZ73_007077 [Actinomortierella ambigua]|nr:hypothetical protein BGZ73_007077 [Actinomortierella ambigua]